MRLIDADALEERIKYRYDSTASPQVLVDALGWALRRVRNAPTIENVKHGHWLWELADNGWANHICSECGYTENTDIHVSIDWAYCPHCGAFMKDGGKS